jgi:hypothetical protein
VTEQQPPVEFEPAPVIATITPKKRNPLDMVLVLAAVVALAGVAFATGRLTAPVTATPAAAQQQGAAGASGQAGAAGQNGQAGGRARGSFDPNASFAPGQGGFGGQGGQGALGGGAGITLTGTVTAITSTSVTLKLENGTEVTIPIEPTTTYHQSTTSSASAVTSGLTVQVRVTGGAGGQRQPGASAAPGATPGTATMGNALDITIVK